LTAHIATCRDGRPHVAPVWYLYDDGSVWIATSGRKLADIRTNPSVAMSIEKSERGLPEWTATLRGTASVVEDSDAFERVNGRITGSTARCPAVDLENSDNNPYQRRQRLRWWRMVSRQAATSERTGVTVSIRLA